MMPFIAFLCISTSAAGIRLHVSTYSFILIVSISPNVKPAHASHAPVLKVLPAERRAIVSVVSLLSALTRLPPSPSAMSLLLSPSPPPSTRSLSKAPSTKNIRKSSRTAKITQSLARKNMKDSLNCCQFMEAISPLLRI